MGCQHLFQLKNSCYLFNSNKTISFQYFHQSFILISCIDTSKLPLNWKLCWLKLPKKTICRRLSFNCSRLLTVYHFNNNVKSKTSPFSNINNMYLINKINLIFLKFRKCHFRQFYNKSTHFCWNEFPIAQHGFLFYCAICICCCTYCTAGILNYVIFNFFSIRRKVSTSIFLIHSSIRSIILYQSCPSVFYPSILFFAKIID